MVGKEGRLGRDEDRGRSPSKAPNPVLRRSPGQFSWATTS